VYSLFSAVISLFVMASFIDDFLNEFFTALPGIIGAIIIIVIGVIVGWGVGRLADRIVDRTVEKNFDKSRIGQSFRSAGFDLSKFVGGVLYAFVVVVSISVAVQFLNIQGTAGIYIAQIASYLPRLLGGILVIVLGIVLVDFLASLVGTTIKPMFGEKKAEIADMLRNMLFIGLVAVVLNIALDLLLLSAGGLVYSLIIGFVIIGAGVALSDGLIKSITDDHDEFKRVAGYAKFILYAVFLLIGAGAIFSSFSGVTSIVGNIAWGFAIAFALVLVPIIYSLAKRMNAEIK
jgi:hypothetical protein